MLNSHLRNRPPFAGVYAFAGGGTGGHVIPGVAIARGLQAVIPQAVPVFIGSEKPFEREIVGAAGFSHIALPVEPPGAGKRHPVHFLLRNFATMWKAWRWMRKQRPRLVVGLGGYVSAPLVIVAAWQKVPIILLEQNAVPGRATRWLARYATETCVAFESAALNLPQPVSVTGTPVRPEIAALFAAGDDRQLEAVPPRLLILGGSQGAISLNEIVLEALAGMREVALDWQIVHQSGVEQVEIVRGRYAELGLNAEVHPFITDMAEEYRRTSLVISRAGASTIAELACAGCPAVLVPYPYAADDHQLKNAEELRTRLAARLVVQEQDRAKTVVDLQAELFELMRHREPRFDLRRRIRELARPAALRDVVQRMLLTCGRTEKEIYFATTGGIESRQEGVADDV